MADDLVNNFTDFKTPFEDVKVSINLDASPGENDKNNEDNDDCDDNDDDMIKTEDEIGKSESARFICNICGRRFKYNSALEEHHRTHTGEKPYQCDICHTLFAHKGTRNRHMRSHLDEKPFKCEHCNKCFSRKSDLKSHQRIHTGEKPYKCHVCDKSFRVSGDLLVHQRIHSGERPYVCNICGMAFIRTQHLKSHVLRHANVKKFQCEMCTKSFNTARYLKVHVRKQHRNGSSFTKPVIGITHVSNAHIKREKEDNVSTVIKKEDVNVKTETDNNEVGIDSDTNILLVFNQDRLQPGMNKVTTLNATGDQEQEIIVYKAPDSDENSSCNETNLTEAMQLVDDTFKKAINSFRMNSS